MCNVYLIITTNRHNVYFRNIMSNNLTKLKQTQFSLFTSCEEIYASRGIPYLNHQERKFNDHQKRLDMLNEHNEFEPEHIPFKQKYDASQFKSDNNIVVDEYENIVQQIESELRYVKGERNKYKFISYVLFLILFLKCLFI